MSFKISHIALLLLGFLVFGCIDDTFDTPPSLSEEDLSATMTIKDFKALGKTRQSIEITDDVILGGLVISDDKPGNFYKTLVIQDETGGLPVSINATDLYTLFERGRKVWIRAKGLTLTDNNNQFYLDLKGDRIPDNLYRQYIIRGSKGVQPAPKTKKLLELRDDDIGTLVTVQDVEFSIKDKSKNYADATAPGNRTVEDCIGNSIIVRTSNYSDFADLPLPKGNGTITGVLSRYRNDLQLGIRDTGDVVLNNPSCLGGGGGDLTRMTIKEVRALFSGSSTSVPAGKKIEGVVTSDRNAGNIHSKNMVVQDETGGIAIRFTRDHRFNLNDKVELDISGLTLSEYQGLLQISNVPTDNAQTKGTGSVVPKEITVAEILNSFELYESTLVRLKDVEFSGASTFGGGPKVKDNTGEIVLFTRNQATFANESVPANAMSLNAIVTQGGSSKTMQLSLRNLNDIDGSGGGGTGGGTDTLSAFTEDFESMPDGVDINSNGWKSFIIEGERNWRVKLYKGSKYAQATAFKDKASNMETMLITPPMKLDKPKKFAFQSAKAYWDHDGLSVWISTDFDGANPGNATWKELKCTLAAESDADHAWIDSGDIDLSAYSGVGYIAFKYVGSAANSQTGTFRIDNVTFGDK